jgi:hypothetical protein
VEPELVVDVAGLTGEPVAADIAGGLASAILPGRAWLAMPVTSA